MMSNDSIAANEVVALPSRMTELEIKLTYAEDQIEALNRAIYQQGQLIDRLQFELNALRQQQLQSSSPAEVRSLRDELPPHY